MKKVAILLFLILSFECFSQNIMSFPETHKKGVVGSNNDVNQPIIPFIYQNIIKVEDKFILIDTILFSKKKGKYYSQVKIANLKGEIIQSFDKVGQIRENFIVVENNKTVSLFNIKSNQFVQKACDNIIFSNNSTKHFLIEYHGNDKSGVISSNDQTILSFKTDKKIEKSDFYFIVGKKNKSVYNYKGELLVDNVKKVTDFTGCARRNYKKCILSNGNQSIIGNQNIIFENYDVEFNSFLCHENRFIYKNKEGYFIIDSTGKVINQTAYQFVDKFGFNDVKSPTLVQQNDLYFFVDYYAKPISSETFYHVETLFTNNTDCYKVKKLKTDKGYYAYHIKGEPYLNEMVDNMEVVGDFDDLIVLTTDNKYAVALYDTKVSDFIYYSKPEGFSNDEFLHFKSTNKAGEYILINEYNFLTGGDYSGLGLTDIKIAQEEQFYDMPVFLLYKNEKFSLAFDYVKTENDSLKFEYDNYYVDYELADNLEVFVASKNGKIGLLNLYTGKVLSEFKYDKIEVDEEILDYFNYIKVINLKKEGLIQLKKGKYIEVLPAIYDGIELSDEFLIIEKDKKYTIYYMGKIHDFVLTEKPTSEFILNYDFELFVEGEIDGKSCQCFFNSYSATVENRILCYEEIVNPKWSDELFFYKENGKLGILGERFDTIIVAQFDDIQLHPNEDYLLTSINGKKGVRDQRGHIIIPEKYNELISDSEFYTEFVKVKMNNKWGLYSGTKLMLKLEFEEIILSDEFVYVKQNGKWGMYNYSLKLEMNITYESLKALKEAYSKM